MPSLCGDDLCHLRELNSVIQGVEHVRQRAKSHRCAVEIFEKSGRDFALVSMVS